MKQRLTALSMLFLVMSLSVTAQFKLIGKGPSFEEPEKGYDKLLLLKNGKTAYIHAESSGLRVKIFGADYKQAGIGLINSTQGKLSELNVEGIFESGGNIVALVSEYEKNVPILYRFVIDGNTGRKISEDKIAQMQKESLGSVFANAFGVPVADFLVRKDPSSDHYVVAVFNTGTTESDKRLEFITYDGTHKEISRSYMSSPENKFKYVNLLDLAILPNQEVFALIYVYNTESKGGKENDLLMAAFKPGDQEVAYTNMNLDEKDLVTDGIMKYNPAMKKLVAMTCVKEKTKRRGDTYSTYYSFPMYFIDPSNKNIQTHAGLSLDAVDNKHRELYGSKDGYSGILQNLYIHNDGGYTVVMEGLKTVTTPKTVNQYYGSLAVLNYGMNGSLKSSALIPKSHEYNNNSLSGGGVSFGWGASAARKSMKKTISMLYHRDRDWMGSALGGGNQYKSFAYLSAPTKDYVLINDVDENEELIRKGKLKNIMGVSSCDGFSFVTNGNDVLPARSYVFGAPKDKDHTMAVFSVSDYDPNSNVYVTLRLEVDGRDKKVRVVWLQPE